MGEVSGWLENVDFGTAVGMLYRGFKPSIRFGVQITLHEELERVNARSRMHETQASPCHE